MCGLVPALSPVVHLNFLQATEVHMLSRRRCPGASGWLPLASALVCASLLLFTHAPAPALATCPPEDPESPCINLSEGEPLPPSARPVLTMLVRRTDCGRRLVAGPVSTYTSPGGSPNKSLRQTVR